MSKKYLYLALYVGFTCFTACKTAKPATAHRSRQPRFLDDIYMDKHNKNSATSDAINKSRIPEKSSGGHAFGKSEYAYTPKKKTNTKTNEEHYKNKDAGNGVAYNPYFSLTDPEKIKNKYAMMLNVNQEDIEHTLLYQFIDEWYGVCYRSGGCDKSGIDCSGFVQQLYNKVFGIDLPRTSREQFDYSDRIKKVDKADEGDLIFFKVHSKRITHVGVYLMNNYFVHASTSQGIMISSLNEEYWHKYYAGAGKVKR